MKGDHIGEFEELVLLAVAAVPEAYGVSIKARLDVELTRDVTIGAVYAALDRLEDKALVRSAEVAGPAERGGRRRRAFVITSEGRRVMRDLRSVRERLWRAVPSRNR